jgi:hypothetical protein
MGKHPKGKKSAANNETPKTATLPILSKLSSVSADDRAWACASLGNLLLHPTDETVRLQLLKSNVIGHLIHALTDETIEVVLEAAGALHSALLGEPGEPDGLIADMFHKDILTPLLALTPRIRKELRKLLHPPPVQEMDIDMLEVTEKKKKKKKPIDTSGDSFKLYTRLSQQLTASLQALAESSDTMTTKHTPLRIISLNPHVIPFLVDLADGFKSTSRMTMPAEVSQLALQTLLTLVQDNDDACSLIVNSSNNIVEKLFDLVATRKHTHVASENWTAEEVEFEAKRLLSASVLFQVVFADLKKSLLDKSDMLSAIVRVTSQALNSVAHDLQTGQDLIMRMITSKKPMTDIGNIERLMEAIELRHVALELAVNLCAEKEKPSVAVTHVEKPDIVDEIIPEFETFPDSPQSDHEMDEASDEEEVEDSSVIGLVRHHKLIDHVTQVIAVTEGALKKLDQQLDAIHFRQTLIELDETSDQEDDAASPQAIAKLVIDYRTVVSGMLARGLAALHNLIAIQPKPFFSSLPAEYWTSLMTLLRESFKTPEQDVASLLRDEEEWAECQAAIMGTLWKIVQKTHNPDEPDFEPSVEDIDFFLQILTRGSDTTVQSQAAAILGILAQQPNIKRNELIGTTMVRLIEEMSVRDVEPDELPLISEMLNSLFDAYADKSYPCNHIFHQEEFGPRLETAYYKLKASVKKVDGRKYPEERLQTDEAMMNLKNFIGYKEREERK